MNSFCDCLFSSLSTLEPAQTQKRHPSFLGCFPCNYSCTRQSFRVVWVSTTKDASLSFPASKTLENKRSFGDVASCVIGLQGKQWRILSVWKNEFRDYCPDRLHINLVLSLFPQPLSWLAFLWRLAEMSWSISSNSNVGCYNVHTELTTLQRWTPNITVTEISLCHWPRHTRTSLCH